MPRVVQHDVRPQVPLDAPGRVLAGEIVAVVEFNALPHMKSPGISVVGDLPTLGYPRLELRSLPFQEIVVHAPRHALGRFRIVGRRIKFFAGEGRQRHCQLLWRRKRCGIALRPGT
jgi:hypothetical protein